MRIFIEVAGGSDRLAYPEPDYLANLWRSVLQKMVALIPKELDRVVVFKGAPPIWRCCTSGPVYRRPCKHDRSLKVGFKLETVHCIALFRANQEELGSCDRRPRFLRNLHVNLTILILQPWDRAADVRGCPLFSASGEPCIRAARLYLYSLHNPKNQRKQPVIKHWLVGLSCTR